ncbi:MAG: S8 family serine peptidase, partial [Armatimonadetes bacterium]|nr:S8 family serine peptidase [Armatimonadota bacterium]
HGTHVAGTIGARGNNSVGVTGICHTVKIMPLKFLDAEGSGSSADAILAIDFARTHGARIMNNSWGSGGFSQLLLEAIQRARDAGILIVAAAGNEGLNNDDAPFFPASNNIFTDNVVSVAATDRNDLLASFSNFGQNSVDIAAPGVAILSTTPGDTYRTFSGTSMATPHVSGAAALLLARYPFLTPAQLKARLLFNVDRPSTLAGKVATGRLNVNQALVTDDISPGKPSALTTSGRASSALLLTWNASGDDGLAGVASQYDLRYQTAPISEANFGAANRAANLPKPGPSGSRQSYLLTGLAPNTTYYVALRAVDNVGNVSSLATTGPFSTLATTCLLDDVEGVPQFSGTSPWAVTTEQSASPTHSYTDSPGTFYAANRDISLTQNTAVTLSAGEPLLAFRARTNLEDHFDFLHVEVTADGGATWQRVLSLTGTTDWTYYSVPLTAYSGRSVRVRFRLITDEAIAGDGVWLDDIRICASVGARVSAFDDDVEGTPTFVGPPPWAVTATDSFSPTQSYTDSPGTQYVDNLDSSLTQVSEVSLAGFVPILTFMAKTSLEFGFDLLHVEVSIDGGATWQQQKLVLTGTTNWSQYSVPLARYFGQSVKVRFRLVTDSSVTDDGVLLDDIRIGGEQILPVGVNLPAPPDNLTATGVSSSQIDLAWADNSNNESGFIIERSADGVSFAPVHTVGANVRTYSDAGLTANTFYFHRVRATSAAGDSAYSNVASAATLPAPGGKLKVSRRVNFGRVGVSSSTTRSLLIRNASRTESLDIRVGRPENPYIIESGGGAVTIPPHGRHLVTLRFQPTVGTRFTGSVSIVSGDPARPTASVTLIGRGK